MNMLSALFEFRVVPEFAELAELMELAAAGPSIEPGIP
jgi:hypothetical protein